MMNRFRFIDLFAGAGGLSEGFIRAGFESIAHVEKDAAACATLRTRSAYHYLRGQKDLTPYIEYLNGKIDRAFFLKQIPDRFLDAVINQEINSKTIHEIISRIEKINKTGRIDLIIGGPPCQAYSIIGRSRDQNKMAGDSRNYLYTYYIKFLSHFQPKYFVFENVTGLLSAKDLDGLGFFEKMNVAFKEIGYRVEHKILNAKDYGVPQDRKRVIIIGKKGGTMGFYPVPKEESLSVTISELLNDLPNLNQGEGSYRSCRTKAQPSQFLIDAKIHSPGIPISGHQARPHRPQDLEIYNLVRKHWIENHCKHNYNLLPEVLKTHTNRNAFLDRFKVVPGERYFSHTVVAHVAKDGHYYIHPDGTQNRSLTPREIARLQTFPDDYFFENASERHSRTAAYRQIGNAVPVRLAEKIAEALAEVW